jgi:hypothetical protein
MATTTNTLAAISPAAEIALFGQPSFTCIHTETATALAATVTAPNADQQVRMFHLTLSYSAAPAVSVLTVKDGATVIWQCDISATGRFVYTFDFSAKPLRGSKGAALSANVGSAGGSVVQTISWTGDYIKAP